MISADRNEPEPSPRRLVQAGDVELLVLEHGRGMPVVFLHGFPLDHSMWDAQSEPLAERWRVVAPDLRGFGGSQVVAGTASMEQMADDVAALLDALAIDEPIVLCGLSMGGYVALEFSRRHPDRLRGLVLCDTRAAADTPEAARSRHETVDKIMQEGIGLLADAMLPKLFAPETLERRSNLTAIQRQVILKTSPEGAAAALRGMAQRRDFCDALPKISVPALVVVGEHDAISPVDEMRAMAQAMPSAEFVVLPNAGHMSPLENAEGFNAAIEAFLARLDRGG